MTWLHDMTCHVNVVPTAAAQHDDLAQAGVVGCGALTAAVVTTVPPGVVNDRLYIAGARPFGTLTKASDASPAVADVVATVSLIPSSGSFFDDLLFPDLRMERSLGGGRPPLWPREDDGGAPASLL